MSENILEVKNLCKKYKDFSLKNINLAVPKGCIVGLVGENGAGKSTIIKSVLGLRRPDEGEILVMGKSPTDQAMKEDIGVVLDECNFPEEMTVKEVNSIMSHVYKNWQSAEFTERAKQFHLPEKQKIKEYSRGMQMKLSIAVALSHKAKLLILDEATSGLDPVVREDVLDVLLDFIQEEEHGVLISSHIISDLEKASDYISFIHEGEVFFTEPKDDLKERFVVLKCTEDQFRSLDQSTIERYRRNKFEIEVLIRADKAPKGIIKDRANIEDIMLFYIKGEKEDKS